MSRVDRRTGSSVRLEFQRSFLPIEASVVVARDLAGEIPGSTDTRDAARSIVSELAANACLHARTQYTVTLIAEPIAITVAVRDRSRVMPELRPLTSYGDHGRGLHIVDALADEWGTTPHGVVGKTVWARLDRLLSMPDEG